MTMYVHCTCIQETSMHNSMPIKQCGAVKLIKLSSMAAKHDWEHPCSVRKGCTRAV